jgi:hypothetical protein
MVSVVMTVYNGEKYLAAAIQSVLDQTYRDLELIVVDDGSSDRSSDIIGSFQDPRVVKISRSNRGRVEALNTGIAATHGVYVACHDADDLSVPTRVELQVGYLDKHEDVALVGSNYHIIDARGGIVATTDVFTRPDDLELAEVASNQFGHGAVMIRSEVLRQVGGYDSRFKVAHDVDLWTRIGRTHRLANLATPLYLWRNVGEGLSTTAEGERTAASEADEIRRREFARLTGRQLAGAVVSLHPRSTRGGVVRYLGMKNRMHRGLALLAAYEGRRVLALGLLLMAALHAPWVKRTYRQALVTFKRPDAIAAFPYDFI